MNKSYEVQQTLLGSYGYAHAGDVIQLPEDQAKPLLDNGVIKEITGKEKSTVTVADNTKEKKDVKPPKEKKVIKKPGS